MLGVPVGFNDQPQAAGVLPKRLTRAKAKLGKLRRLQPTQTSRKLRIITTGLVPAVSYGAEVVGLPDEVASKLLGWELRAQGLVPRGARTDLARGVLPRVLPAATARAIVW